MMFNNKVVLFVIFLTCCQACLSANKSIRISKDIPLEQQLLFQDTEYIFESDVDLHGKIIDVPDNCVLNISKSIISNGTLKGNYVVNAPKTKVFDNVIISLPVIYSSWVGISAHNINNNNSDLLEYAVNTSLSSKVKIIFDEFGYYDFYKPVELTKCVELTSQWFSTEHTVRLRFHKPQVFITFRKAACCITNIQFEGLCGTYGSGTTLLNFQLSDSRDEEKDYLNDVDALIQNCTFYKASVCIRLTGRQSRIIDNTFMSFFTGIVFDDLNIKGDGGGASRGNIIKRCNFHASSPFLRLNKGRYEDSLQWSNSSEEYYSCILNKSDVAHSFTICDCKSDCLNSFFRGNLIDSYITNNHCYNCYHEILWLNDVLNSMLTNNKFSCNNDYSESGISYFGQNCGITITGHCANNVISGNMIQRSQWGAIRVVATNVTCKFTHNHITNNYFLDVLDCDSEDNNVIVFLNCCPENNIISNNAWTSINTNAKFIKRTFKKKNRVNDNIRML